MAANFENFLISLDFPINFRKSHQISKNYLKSSESYGQKPLGVPKDPLASIGLKQLFFVLIAFITVENMSCIHIKQ